MTFGCFFKVYLLKEDCKDFYGIVTVPPSFLTEMHRSGKKCWFLSNSFYRLRQFTSWLSLNSEQVICCPHGNQNENYLFLNLRILSRTLNCCHLFEKFTFPSGNQSWFPIWMNVRSWRISPLKIQKFREENRQKAPSPLLIFMPSGVMSALFLSLLSLQGRTLPRHPPQTFTPVESTLNWHPTPQLRGLYAKRTCFIVVQLTCTEFLAVQFPSVPVCKPWTMKNCQLTDRTPSMPEIHDIKHEKTNHRQQHSQSKFGRSSTIQQKTSWSLYFIHWPPCFAFATPVALQEQNPGQKAQLNRSWSCSVSSDTSSPWWTSRGISLCPSPLLAPESVCDTFRENKFSKSLLQHLKVSLLRKNQCWQSYQKDILLKCSVNLVRFGLCSSFCSLDHNKTSGICQKRNAV